MRYVNDRIEHLQAYFAVSAPVIDFLCECRNPSCATPIGLTRDEYEYARETADRFIVARGHESPAAETIIASSARHSVVEVHAAVHAA